MAVFVFGAPSLAPRYSPAFEDNTWLQIIESCQENKVPDTWEVGDSKVMRINNIDYKVSIIGKNHDEYSDGTGTAPLTFQLEECYTTLNAMNGNNTNDGGWTNSYMRTTTLPAILDIMPPEVLAAIREVNKPTSTCNFRETIAIDADKLFLLSEVEVFGLTSRSFPGEGRQYDYYLTASNRIKNRSGAPSNWWLRSPYRSTNTQFVYVVSSGASNSDVAVNTFGVPFAFCF